MEATYDQEPPSGNVFTRIPRDLVEAFEAIAEVEGDEKWTPNFRRHMRIRARELAEKYGLLVEDDEADDDES